MKSSYRVHRIPNKLTRKIVSLIAITIALFLTAKLLSFTLPGVRDAAGKAAVISAGLTLPEGGRSLLLVSDKNEAKTQKNLKSNKSNNEDNQNISQPPTVTFDQNEIDKYNQNSGEIIRKKYESGGTSQYIKVDNNAYIRNMTDLPNETVTKASNDSPAFKLNNSKDPQVLIVHTHTSEAFELSNRNFYDASYPTRSLDNSRNVVRVGNEITKQLENASIGVIHDTTIHDSPEYNGAYDRSKITIEKELAEHPSIKVVLDIHRDAIGSENGPRYAPVTTINGKQAAQLMIISGCDSGDGKYPNFLQNLSFASLLEKQTEKDYPSLTRPVSFKYKYYNQSLTPGTLLVEIGGHANSVDEVVYSGWMFGKSLANALKTITE